PPARVLRRTDPKRRRHRRDAARRASGQRQALTHRQPARAVRDLRSLCTGRTADVWRWHGRAGRGPRADRAARRFVPRRCAQRRGAERIQRGRPGLRPAGQPAGAAPRGHRLSLGGVEKAQTRGGTRREATALKAPAACADKGCDLMASFRSALRPRVGLVGKFALTSVVPIVLLGLALAHVLRAEIKQRALVNARESAALLETTLIEPQLS